MYSKLILFTVCLFNCLFSFSQEIDTATIIEKIEKSAQLEFVDPLLARDYSYEAEVSLMDRYYKIVDDSTTTKNKSDLAIIKLWGETELTHAKNHYWLGYYEAAIHIYQKSISAFSIIDSNSTKVAECLARQAVVLNKQGESQSALQNLLRAKKIYTKQKMLDEVNWCEAIISSCYFMQDKTEDAKKRCLIAINELEQSTQPLYLLDAYFIYTQFFIYTRIHIAEPTSDYEPCQKIIEKAILLAKKLKNKPN